jgi:hypothetical protein
MSPRPRLACLLALCPLLVVPAIAQDLRPESLVPYGGTYSPDCADTSAPRASITAQGLVISQGTHILRTPALMDSYTSFGAAPTSPVPEEYRVEFIGDAFSLYVFEDARGKYVPLQDYVPQAEKIVGAAGMRARFSRCE